MEEQMMLELEKRKKEQIDEEKRREVGFDYLYDKGTSIL